MLIITNPTLRERIRKKTPFLSKITLKLDNLHKSEYQDYLMKWVSLIGLLICGSVNVTEPYQGSLNRPLLVS